MKNMLNGFPKESVTVIKKSGEKYENIEALIRPKKIFIDDSNIPIEEEDKIIRELSNGITETYIVVDPGFCKGISSIPDHYNIIVERESLLKKKQENSSTIIINNNGQNSKANINSTDNSMNNYNNENKVFNELKTLANSLPEGQREVITKSIDEMEKNYGQNRFKEKYSNFIQAAADHMTLFSPLIPILTNMITK